MIYNDLHGCPKKMRKTGGFLYGFSHGFSLDKCGLFGSILAGKVIEVIGARMPDEKWAEAKKMIQEVASE